MNGGTAVEKKKQTEVEVYKQQKEWLMGIAERAPLRGGVTKERLALSTLQAIKKDPKLVAPGTDMESFRIAVVEAGQMGLLPDGRRGALLKYGAEVQFQPMVWGLVELMIRAGCKKAESRVVYTNDRYEIEYGTDPRIVHVPATGERGDPVSAYAVVWLASGATQFEPMSKAEIYVIRGRSKAFKNGKGPWLSDELEMWRKTPLKRLAKYVPQTEELTLALQRDDEIEYVDATVEDVAQNGSLNDKLAEWRAQNGKEKAPAESSAAEASPGDESTEGEEAAEEEAGDDAGEAPEEPGAGDAGAEPEEDDEQALARLAAQWEEVIMEYRPEWTLKEIRLFEMGNIGLVSDDWTADQYRQAIKMLSSAPARGRKKVTV